MQTAGRLMLSAAASWERSEVDDQSSFFGYERQVFEGRLGYELSPRLTASVSAAYDRIPTPDDRPDRRGRGALARPRAPGRAGAAHHPPRSSSARATRRTRARARAAGPIAASCSRAACGRELGREATLRLSGTRATFPSAFEQNAFYVSSGGGVELDLAGTPVLRRCVLATGYHWNDYRTPAADTGSPRRDTMWDGAVGLARSLSHRAWVRADYRRERRNSDLDMFDVTTQALTVQIGIGFLGSPGR